MSDDQKTATSEYADDVTPESMMSDFRGRPVVRILSLTVVVHVVLVGVFSLGYLKRELLGEDTSGKSEEERLKIAVQEAKSSLLEIAERHGLSAQDLTDQFAAAKAPPASSAAGESAGPSGPEATSPTTSGPDEPESAIERELNTTTDGPDLPELPPDLPAEEDDLF